MIEALRRQLGRHSICLFAGFCVGLALWLATREVAQNSLATHEKSCVELGLWGTRFLIFALAITPLSRQFREPSLRRWRRPLGLAAVGFAALHAIQYVVYFTAWPDLPLAMLSQPYLVVGLFALLFLLPLALTSSNAAVRLIGPPSWKAVHRLIYPAAALTGAHEIMSDGASSRTPVLQALAISVLLAYRLPIHRLKLPHPGKLAREHLVLRPWRRRELGDRALRPSGAAHWDGGVESQPRPD